MSFNLLQDLPRSGFLKLKTLETLDLSFNDLRQVDDRTFEDMHWLSVLKVYCNTIYYSVILVLLIQVKIYFISLNIAKYSDNATITAK